MEKELDKRLMLQDVTHSVAHNFGKVFHSQVVWRETLDALLEEKVGVPSRPPEELRRLHKEDDIHWA
jgi:heme oxygenase